MPTRLISFAGSALTIEFTGPKSAQVVELLYRHVPSGQSGTSQLTYRLLNDGSETELRLYRDKTLICRGNCAGSVAELLLGDSCSQLAAHCYSGLIFHAAALAWQGQGLMLPGISGAGKSTLTAWLVSQGFDYLSDELVFVPWQTDCIQAFARPINLKSPARWALRDTFNFEKHAAGILSSPYADLVPPTLFHPFGTRSETIVNLIIFPQYQADSRFELRRLPKAQAGLSLLQTLINARNLPQHGFSEITRLIRQIPAYRLRYSNFNQIGHHIKNLMVSNLQKLP